MVDNSNPAEAGKTLLSEGAPAGELIALPPEMWRRMQYDWEVGGFTPKQIAEHHGVGKDRLVKHAQRYGWTRPAPRIAPPMRPAPKPEEILIDAAGGEHSNWLKLAHAAQLAPAGAWSTWLFQGGRGAGKTRAGAEWLAARAEASPGGVFALVGPTYNDVRTVMIEGVSGLQNLPGRQRPAYEAARRRLRWENGATAFAYSAEEPERLRGPQFEAAWADEFCIWPKPAQTLANLRLALRRGARPQLVVTTTPKPIAAFRKLRAEPSCVVTHAASAINAANLAPTFLSGLETLYGGTRLAAQELEGLLVEGDAALFRAEDLARARAGAKPEGPFDLVVVAVDPPAGFGGSACGIVVAARQGDRFFVLADDSAHGLSPLGWASRAVDAARRFSANAIVAEANQGGEMVRATLKQARPPCAIDLVHARHGKRARAEPASALYEQGRVTHLGAFAALEQELMALGGEEGEGESLDRADALVWALTALGEMGLGPRIRALW